MVNECKNKNVEMALELLVGKWKPIILYHIFSKEVVRFSELQRLIPGISKKALTTQLRELEHHDIVHREVYPVVPPKVEYSITEYGQGILPMINAMHLWGEQHIVHLIELYGDDYNKKV